MASCASTVVGFPVDDLIMNVPIKLRRVFGEIPAKVIVSVDVNLMLSPKLTINVMLSITFPFRLLAESAQVATYAIIHHKRSGIYQTIWMTAIEME